MVRIEMVSPLTDFKRNTGKFRARMKKSGQPELLTVEGRGEIVVQDAGAYQKLLDEIDRLEAIEGIRKGLESIAAGKGKPIAEAFSEIKRRLKSRKPGRAA